MPDWSKCTHVYVARGPLGHKVGIAGNVPSRLRFVQHEAGAPVTLVRSWRRPSDARLVEYNAHLMLQDHLVGGLEWFDVPEQEAIAAVATAMERVDAGAHAVPTPQRKRRKDRPHWNAAAWERWQEEAEAYLKTPEGVACLKALEGSSA